MLAVTTSGAMPMSEPVRVTTEAVLAAIREFPIESFTTFEIAEAMGVPEYPVRAAMSWLVARKIVVRAGARKLMTKPVIRQDGRPPKPEPYWATTYVLKEQSAPVDFSALMGAFCRG
jgi:hypothetical protein